MSYLLPTPLIVKKPKCFNVAKQKLNDLVINGIAPYFPELLDLQLMELEHFVALFDESHNKVEKQGLMEQIDKYSIL